MKCSCPGGRRHQVAERASQVVVPPLSSKARGRLLEQVFRLASPRAKELFQRLYFQAVRVEAMGDAEFASVLRFALLVAHLPEEMVPELDDPEDVLGFLAALQRLFMVDPRIDVALAPPDFATGCSVLRICGSSSCEDVRFFSGMKRHGFMQKKDSLPPLEQLLFDDSRISEVMHWGGLFRQLTVDLQSRDKKRRMTAQTLIRFRDNKYKWTQGLVFARHVISNRMACLTLLEELRGADCVVSLMRGGSYLGDQLALLSVAFGDGSFPPHTRVPKPSKSVIGSCATRFAKGKKTTAKKLLHTFMLIRSVELLARQESGRLLNVAIVETLVGGGSTNLLLRGLGFLVQRCPNLRIKLLLHRHTLHQVKPVSTSERFVVERKVERGRMGPIPLDLSDESHVINLQHFSGQAALENQVEYERYGDAGYLDTVPVVECLRGGRRWDHELTITVGNGEYILGEDIDFYMSGREQHPLILFSGPGEGLLIEPGMIDSKLLLHLVVCGYFDRYLPGIEFWQHAMFGGSPRLNLLERLCDRGSSLRDDEESKKDD